MSTIQIQLLTVTPGNQPTKTPGKTTPVLELAYKNLTFQGKVEGRKLFSFGGNKGGYDVLVNGKSGEIYEIYIEKSPSGFNEWFSAKKLESDPSSATTPGSTPSQPRVNAVTPKSSYPSDEERAKVQIYIVRQSTLAQAVNVHTVGAKTPPKLDDILATAKVFEDHVFGTTKEVEAAPPVQGHEFDDLDDFPDLPN